MTGTDWRHRAVCREEDPELFFPVGTTGPAEIQVEQAKAVCRRCSVADECLKWALESGQDAGVWGGMSEAERLVLLRPGRVPAAAPLLAEQFPPVEVLEAERPKPRRCQDCREKFHRITVHQKLCLRCGSRSVHAHTRRRYAELAVMSPC